MFARKMVFHVFYTHVMNLKASTLRAGVEKKAVHLFDEIPIFSLIDEESRLCT